MSNYNVTEVITDITGNGTFPALEDAPLLLGGHCVLAMYGALGGATVEFVFYTQKPDGTLVELPVPDVWQFTALPAPEWYAFSASLPFRIRVSGGTGVNFGVNAHKLQ